MTNYLGATKACKEMELFISLDLTSWIKNSVRSSTFLYMRDDEQSLFKSILPSELHYPYGSCSTLLHYSKRTQTISRRP